jgi:hypothetical protein
MLQMFGHFLCQPCTLCTAQKLLLEILFLISEEKFHVGSQLELQLEFRTSENTGVLLSVSEPDGYPALSLEINDGKVSSRHQTSNFVNFLFQNYNRGSSVSRNEMKLVNTMKLLSKESEGSNEISCQNLDLSLGALT